MSDPRVLSLVSFVFALLTAYSLSTGTRQVRDARRAGRAVRWYKQLSLLTGIEYGLLTFVFLLRTATAQGAIAPGMQPLVAPLYLILLIPAAIIAGLVIHRVFVNMRTRRAVSAPATSLPTPTEEPQGERVPSKQEREKQTRRQRERRKKAAIARRRQAGKA
jgi:hypothetical protein